MTEPIYNQSYVHTFTHRVLCAVKNILTGYSL